VAGQLYVGRMKDDQDVVCGASALGIGVSLTYN
jgi:hypothetical protein